MGELLLTDVCQVFTDQNSPEKQPSETLVSELVRLEERPWSEWRHGSPMTQAGSARLHKRFEVEPEIMKLNAGRVVRGYRLSDLRDVFAR